MHATDENPAGAEPGPARLSPAESSPPGPVTPPLLPATSTAAPPPPLANQAPLRRLLAGVLSVCLALFLADAFISLADDSLVLGVGSHIASGIRAVIGLLSLFMLLVVYVLLGFTPLVPRRFFLPLVSFSLLVQLSGLLFLVYFGPHLQQVSWAISLAQVLLGTSVGFYALGGWNPRWLLITPAQLGSRVFSARHLAVFLAVNAFVLAPLVLAWTGVCAALAVNRFSDGFLTLRPRGLVAHARSYVRDDGKAVQLIPMSHIGEPEFYRELTGSFPTNSIILMEGVSDVRNLLTNKPSYKRMAAQLGLAEQVEEFRPQTGKMVHADVDVETFGTNTLEFLNFAMLLHGQGLSLETLLKVMRYSPPPGLEEEVLEDLLRKRNRHLIEQIQARLKQSNYLIVPWGAAHMPEVADALQQSGFRLAESREFLAIRFAGRRAHPGRR